MIAWAGWVRRLELGDKSRELGDLSGLKPMPYITVENNIQITNNYLNTFFYLNYIKKLFLSYQLSLVRATDS